MTRPIFLAILSFCFCAAIAHSPDAFAQGTANFTMDTPRKVSPPNQPAPGGPFQIMKVKATVSVTTEGSTTFTITDPQGNVWVAPTRNIGDANSFNTFATPPGAAFGNTVTIVPPATTGSAGDPARRRYVIVFSMSANFDPNTFCTSTQANPIDKWTISVAGPQKIQGVCLESFDAGNNQCQVASRVVPLTEAVAAVEGASAVACLSERPAVDAVVVLDRSGSMGSPVSSTSTVKKIDALHGAVASMMTAWDNLRKNETSPPTDNVGVVFFDSDIKTGRTDPGFWLNELPGITTTLSAGLNPVTSALTSEVTNKVNLVNENSGTSIGGGAKLGAGVLAPGNQHRKVILLMSDGMQNTDPYIGVDSSGRVATYAGSTPNITTPLANQPQIYAVTVGTGAFVDSAVNQNVATASKGFYINSEDDANLMSPFFQELLQNFVKFNTFETARLISGNVTQATPFSGTFSLPTTSHNVSVSLTWPANMAALRLSVLAPGTATPIVQTDVSGVASISLKLPLPSPFDPKMGPWSIKVEIADLIGATTPQSGVPFNIHVLNDDPAIHTDLSVVPANYGTGDRIKLRVKLTEFGLPILGVGANSGDSMVVQLLKPGAGVGDLLSASQSNATPGPPPDSTTAAESKLLNTLKDNPAAFAQKPDTVTLFDDGNPAHGDDVAGDGVYSALYEPQLPGHYNFLFGVQGTAKNVGPFSRMQLQTVYVRYVPDSTTTQFQTSVQGDPRSSIFVIKMTPKTKFGQLFGPGFAPYFWFTSPGATPFKAVDNLDGTYTANLQFTGGVPPAVAAHFLDVSMIITDAVTPDHLPVPLGPGNTFAPVPCTSCQGKKNRYAVFLDLGGAVPHGTFGNKYDPGVSLNAGLEYVVNPHFSIEGILGVHHFGDKGLGDTTAIQFGGGGKAFLAAGPNKPFVRGGIAGYHFTSGTTDFGGYVGAGLLHEFNAHLGLEGAYTFHAVNTPGTASKFSTFQIGLRYVF